MGTFGLGPRFIFSILWFKTIEPYGTSSRFGHAELLSLPFIYQMAMPLFSDRVRFVAMALRASKVVMLTASEGSIIKPVNKGKSLSPGGRYVSPVPGREGFNLHSPSIISLQDSKSLCSPRHRSQQFPCGENIK